MVKKHTKKLPTVKELLEERKRWETQGVGLLETNANYVKQINGQAEALRTKDAEIELLKGKIGQPIRRHLPDTRPGLTHKFSVGGHEGYMNVGLFENGDPGELFITMAKEGSTVGGLMDTIGRLTSIALQYGVTMEELAPKFFHQRFEPSGYTTNPEIKEAASIIDYVFRWLHLTFVECKNPATK
jgi:ribonucleoside-diphosphate reductase alpha chain